MNEKQTFSWKIFFNVLWIIFLCIMCWLCGYKFNQSRSYYPAIGDNSSSNVRLAESQSRINERLVAIDERFKNIDGILSGFAENFTGLRKNIAGLAGSIENSITTDRQLIQQLGAIGNGINSLESRLRSAQIGAGEIDSIADTIDGAAGIIQETNNP
jgi:archaellum component FlaC